MDTHAMDPHGAALAAYLAGDAGAELVVRRDDGFEGRIPVAHFFRSPEAFFPLERTALAACRGRVLDAGAGTGLHTLALQEQGLAVTAIDVSPDAVAVMRQRGVADARQVDVFAFAEGPFDTVLMLGHGIGMVETLAGLDRFLAHVASLLAEGGRLLVDSLDVRVTSDEGHLAYQEAARRAGRYVGEIRMQFGFGGRLGAPCGWLHVDEDTMREHASRAGFACEVLHREPSGDYLARLTR